MQALRVALGKRSHIVKEDRVALGIGLEFEKEKRDKNTKTIPR